MSAKYITGMRPWSRLTLILLLLAPSALAETPSLHLPPDAVTHHEMAEGATTLAYTATAGSLPLTKAKGEKEAEIFYVAFIRDGVVDSTTRPITYAFNGGPGAASAYLDIGALGPRVLDFGPAGILPPRLDHVVDNPDSWLPFTDLVFIDPVGTGYSRVEGEPGDAKKFWEVDHDLAAFAQIIRLHLTRSDRLTSPIYLVGESYGGFRAARLAHLLANEQGISPAGVVLISPVLEFRLMSGDELDLLPWALRLPSYAAVRLEAEGTLTPEALREAEQFALGPYLTGLAAHPDEALYAEVARLTGLPLAEVARLRGRVPLGAYVKEARGATHQLLSRYDGSVMSPDPDPHAGRSEGDPLLQGSVAPFTRGFVAYARDELQFKTDRAFEVLSGEVNRHWDWRESEGDPRTTLGASEALRRALAFHPHLKVMIAHGLTDLQTPYMMSRYVAAHLPETEESRVLLKLYPGGHMMYLRSPSRRLLHDDAMSFYGGGE